MGCTHEMMSKHTNGVYHIQCSVSTSVEFEPVTISVATRINVHTRPSYVL